MSPELTAPRERICATCSHYGWKQGNPSGWRWVCCLKKRFWFPDGEDQPGERKGCEEWA
jgi:hypothetical protein